MAKAKRTLEQLVDQSSAYPGDVSSYYRETPESLLGEPDELQNNIAALIKAGSETGCTAQEVADNIAGLFAPDEVKKKVKHG